MKKRDKESFLLLISELEADIHKLDEIKRENDRGWERIRQGSTDSLDYAALGYTIHNVYCLLENYFLRTAKFFENNLDKDTWHKDLLRRMAIEIEGVRPALLDETLMDELDEFRSFRHVFRNLYQTRIKPERVEMLQKKLPSVLIKLKESHTDFVTKLRNIAKNIE